MKPGSHHFSKTHPVNSQVAIWACFNQGLSKCGPHQQHLHHCLPEMEILTSSTPNLLNPNLRGIQRPQCMEATATSLNRGLDEENVVHLYNRYYSVFQKDGTMPFEATWTDLEIAILSEVSQTEKEKYCMTSIIYRI